jgi:hypothetical protein
VLQGRHDAESQGAQIQSIQREETATQFRNLSHTYLRLWQCRATAMCAFPSFDALSSFSMAGSVYQEGAQCLIFD